jgi:hypothetical protein
MKSTLIAAVILTIVAAIPSDALAIPAFARQKGVPCSSCHIAITRRNDFGDAFRLGGLHWPDDDMAKTSAESTVPMKGTGLLPSFLPRVPPIALVATMSGSYLFEDRQRTAGTPALSLVLGTPLSNHVSVFGTWDGSNAPNELYLHFARILGNDLPVLHFRVGRFEQNSTMFKANEALVSRFLTGTSGSNGFAISESRIGAEASGVIKGRTFWAAGVVENSDLAPHGDVYYHVRHKLGGIDLNGREPETDLEADPSLFDDLSITVGHYGYFGRVRDGDGKTTADIRRFGLETKVQYKQAALWAGVMLGLDRDHTIATALATAEVGTSAPNMAWFAEASYAIRPWLLPMYSYQVEDAAALPHIRQQHDVGVIVMLLENMRIRAKTSVPFEGIDRASGEIQLLYAF